MEVPYDKIKDRDIYLVVGEKGKWIGAFQATFYGYVNLKIGTFFFLINRVYESLPKMKNIFF
jgi:hypothetical protein